MVDLPDPEGPTIENPFLDFEASPLTACTSVLRVISLVDILQYNNLHALSPVSILRGPGRRNRR